MLYMPWSYGRCVSPSYFFFELITKIIVPDTEGLTDGPSKLFKVVEGVSWDCCYTAHLLPLHP